MAPNPRGDPKDGAPGVCIGIGGDALGRALLRGPVGKSPRVGPRHGALGVALGNAQGKAFGMALGMASGKAPGLALGVALRRAFGMALGMAQGAIRKALGIAVWEGHREGTMEGPRDGPSEIPYAWALREHSPAGHIQTEPQAQRSTRLWTWHEKASSWLPKTCECIGFCLI